MKKYFTISNLFFVLAVSYLLYSQIPKVLKSLKLEGEVSKNLGDMVDLKGNPIAAEGPLAYVFWASWCPPCEIELKRIHKMIQDKKIQPHQIVAISIDSQLSDLQSAVKEREYSFPVVWDQSLNLSRSYEVSVTPTIIVVDKKKEIVWATTGLSPLLEVKLNYYLNSED
jgi:thiol-disulfide isomerase/thioredoxin